MEVTVKLAEGDRERLSRELPADWAADSADGDQSRTALLRRCLASGEWDVASLRLLCSSVPGLHVHELLERGRVLYPTRPEEETSAATIPDYRARLQRLRREQEDREYREMTKNVAMGQQLKLSQDPPAPPSFGQEIRSVNKQLTIVLNTVLTVLGAGFAAYKASQLALPEADVALNVMSGVTVGTVVLFADLYFILKSM